MNVLGKELSEKTATLINEITQHLSKPVEYRFTDPSKTASYGQCDPWQPDAYYIFCKESLLSTARKNQVNVAFETNLLHELSHLCQIEEGFPHTRTRSTPVTVANQSYYDSLGALFASTILDLNVDFRLKQNNYTSSYFYSQRIIQAEKIARKGHVYEGHDFLCTALMLMFLKLAADSASVNQLLQLHLAKIRGLWFAAQVLQNPFPKLVTMILNQHFGHSRVFSERSIYSQPIQ